MRRSKPKTCALRQSWLNKERCFITLVHLMAFPIVLLSVFIAARRGTKRVGFGSTLSRESPKSARLKVRSNQEMSTERPQSIYIWLATGKRTRFRLEKCFDSQFCTRIGRERCRHRRECVRSRQARAATPICMHIANAPAV